MTDAERDARNPQEWSEAVMAYCDLKMGTYTRRLHRAGFRNHPVREHWLECYRIVRDCSRGIYRAKGTHCKRLEFPRPKLRHLPSLKQVEKVCAIQ
jgi:hypothetical protein